MSTAILEARGLSVRLSGRAVLSDVDLVVEPGACVTIIGPNGAGKTTLLRALLGLQPLDGGSVTCAGQSLSSLGARARGRFAAYVPQSLPGDPPVSVRQAVELGRFPHQGPFQAAGVADRAAVDAALEACGLTELAERPMGCLSGGERQRTLLAAAFAQAPRVLFLDEPTTGLDPGYQLELVGLLRGWRRQGGTLVLVSHDLHLPGALGGRLVALRAGRVAADAPVVELLRAERLGEIYGAPLEVAALGPARTAVIPAFPPERSED